MWQKYVRPKNKMDTNIKCFWNPELHAYPRIQKYDIFRNQYKVNKQFYNKSIEFHKVLYLTSKGMGVIC